MAYEIIVKIKYMEGLKYYILWVNCPNKDNLIKGHFLSNKKAEQYCIDNDYKILK